MTPFLVVLKKELRDASRDRRALMSLIIFPVIGPLMIYFMLNMIIDLGEDLQQVNLPVVGAEFAPDLMDYLRQNGVTLQSLELAANPEQPSRFDPLVIASLRTAIERREYDYALLVPADFQAHLAASETVSVELHFDSSRTSAGPQVSRVQSLIDGWGRETAVLRLIGRGVPTSVIRPVNISRIDVASAQARAQAIIGMIPLFVIMAAFMSGVGIAVDATAGERERKSLEPLLVNPVRRSQLVLGKWLAAVVFSIVGLVLVMVLNLFALSQVPLEQMGISFIIGAREIVGILLITIPLGFFATSMQMFVGIFARSFKDAQVYIGLMSFLPLLPYFFNILNTTGRTFWMNFVPMLGQNMLLTDVVSGRTPMMMDFVLAAISLLGWSMAFITMATLLLRRERVIFS